MVVGATERREDLSLEPLEAVLPERWRGFTPSPLQAHESRVWHEVGRFLTIHPRAFDGFRSVPRYFHPTASAEALELSLELIWWYFAFDDPFDDDEVGERAVELVERMEQVLRTGVLPSKPSGCEQLAARFRARAQAMDPTGAVWPRFIEGCVQWVGSIEPILRPSAAGVPSVERYLELRLRNVGILPEYTLNELIHGLALSEAFRASADVRRFAELTALVIALFNDVYSYEREARQQTQWNSLELRVLAGASLKQAYRAQIEHARAMVAELEAIELRLRDQGLIVGSLAPSLSLEPAPCHQTAYLRGMVEVMVGHQLWAHEGGRYRSSTSPFLELR